MKNYIGNNNEINKKKYKKSLPPKLNTNAGNVEYNINMFNRAANVGDAPSSAEGMSGMAEAYNRENLITRIKEFGKNYNFSKYSNAQLYAMLNRLADKSNHSVKRKRQDRIDIGNRTMVNDPSYNFDDPDREGDYQVEKLSIREELNRLDHRCIDEDLEFHDLRSLYENTAHTLSSQEKTELKNLLNTTNDPDAVKAYLDSKDPDRKKDEGFVYDRDMLYPGMEFKNDYGVVIKILEPDKFGNVQFSIGDEVRSGNPESIKKMLRVNGYQLNDDPSDSALSFIEFMNLADEYYMEGGSDILEFWDRSSFDEYVKQFGPITKDIALKLMKTMRASDSKDESYSVKSNSTTDSVDVIDDETNRVVSRHRGENALDDANHEKDVMNMNEDCKFSLNTRSFLRKEKIIEEQDDVVIDYSDPEFIEKHAGQWVGDVYIPEVNEDGIPYLPKEFWGDWE